MQVPKGEGSSLTLVIDGQLPQLFKRLVRLGVALFAQQPLRALMKEEGAEEQQARGDELHGHGDAPTRKGVGVECLSDAIVDPEADHRANLVGDLEEACQDATDGRDRQLGDVVGHGGGEGAAGQPSENASGIFDEL